MSLSRKPGADESDKEDPQGKELACGDGHAAVKPFTKQLENRQEKKAQKPAIDDLRDLALLGALSISRWVWHYTKKMFLGMVWSYIVEVMKTETGRPTPIRRWKCPAWKLKLTAGSA